MNMPLPSWLKSAERFTAASPMIEYDVSKVPFPLERDPEVDGINKPRRRRVRRKELQPEHERYRLYSEVDLGEFPPVAWLIKDHLAIGELTCLYGKGDTYKSFVALDWSCHLALHGVLVIYIVSEGASGVRARIAAWRKQHGVEHELPNLRLMPSNISLHSAEDVETFIDAMTEQLGGRKPGLVVVDTLARNFVGGNESSPQDMGMFVEGVEAVRREFETAVLVIHHTTKDGNTERGTEALRNASFAMFKFERQNQNMLVKVTCDRMKDARTPDPLTLRPVRVELPELGEEVSSLVAGWPYGVDSGPDSGRAHDSARPESDPSHSGRERTVLKLVADPNGDPSPAYLAKRLRISQSTAKRTLRSLLNKGFLSAEGSTKDRVYSLTDRGRRSLK